MRKIVYSVAMSLDGYVAGPNGEADWIIMDPEIDFGAMFARFDTVLMGRRSYEAALAMGQGGPMPGINKSIVVSRTMRQEDHPDLTIIGDDLASAVAQLRAEPGKDIWLFGGGLLFKSMLEIGEVDSIQAAIIPILLGDGIPFLPKRSGHVTLRLTGSRIYSNTGIVMLEYDVEKAVA